MFNITQAYDLTSSVRYMEIEAPYVAKKIKPGQFIILRINSSGERVPFTVAEANPEKGTVVIIFQQVGKTTKELAKLKAGDKIQDFVGPLGMPTQLDNIKKAAVVGGGLGCAIAYPLAKSLFNSKAQVDIIAGFRSRDFVILENELKAVSQHLYICTDDGSYGEKGLVTNVLERLIKEGANYDCVIAIGPLIMMKFVSELTRPYGIKTIVSMNPIMIDGTGMCGCCRVTVGGETKFACVDGPDFDGHKVDFDSAMKRLATYKKQERESLDHYCKMLEAADNIK
ncbi:Sulfide dehydrogenase subunit beta [[Clostridium] cellulosi]|uniref:Sulfide dehydrogenase subunit beta n=1 Tax=[Clostridium] cellulosi TaxID=29343 RepID=A0A078KSI6_9FIRM|nr:MAG: sulfide/dihydroorotate dehydrogenase-like FAD/NAD-binding protein [[Clostridium] cellulosi]CDZ24094.1 Sulfide dehydrogenase subunit beta [[Clostridium] cellulosi]